MSDRTDRRPGAVLGRIDQELRDLWAAPGAGEPPKARACTMNLVVVTATPELALEWQAIVDDVLLGVPARAIVVGLDPDGADDADGSVSAVCAPGAPGTAGPVCAERVSLTLRGSLCERIHSCVGALVSTDVPLTLVWLARVRVDDPAFAPLARDANRVVLESGGGSLSSLAHVLAWARARPDGERPGVAELAWTRVAPWQELCAQMFDSSALRAVALGVTRVSIVQASPPGAGLGPEGALLLGWLATRLGWKASSLAGKLRLLRADGAHLTVQLRAEAVPWAARGTILAVELDAAAGGVSLRGTLARSRKAEDEPGAWRLEVTGDGAPRALEQTVRFPHDVPARTLERTLRRPTHDEALAETVTWADELRSEELVCS